MDLQPKVSMTPLHAFAAISAAPPQHRGPGTPIYLQLLATTFSPMPPSTNYVPVLGGQLPSWNYVEVVVGSNLCFFPLFFFFFCQEGSRSATSLRILDSKEGSGLPAPNEIPGKKVPLSGEVHFRGVQAFCALSLNVTTPSTGWPVL